VKRKSSTAAGGGAAASAIAHNGNSIKVKIMLQSRSEHDLTSGRDSNGCTYPLFHVDMDARKPLLIPE